MLTVHPLALVGVLLLGIVGGALLFGVVLHRLGYSWVHDAHCGQCGAGFAVPVLVDDRAGTLFCDACRRTAEREAEQHARPCGDCSHAYGEHWAKGCFHHEGGSNALETACCCTGWSSDIEAAAAES